MTLDLQPTLRGALVHLRPLVEGDFASLFAVASDPLIWEQHPDKTRSTLPGFERFFGEGLASGGALLATEAATGEVIGTSRYDGYDASRGEVEVGWTFLARRCWGGRYNGEMKRLMLDHAFRAVDRVVFVVGVHNLRSQHAVLKLGAVLDGPFRKGAGPESYRYVLTRAAWDGQPTSTS